MKIFRTKVENSIYISTNLYGREDDSLDVVMMQKAVGKRVLRLPMTLEIRRGRLRREEHERPGAAAKTH